MSSMTSNRPYLLRGFQEWILDNDLTPYVVINATMPNVHVPERYVEDGKIVLNLSESAALNLKIDNDYIRFTTSFSGVTFIVSAPVSAVIAIYARENGRGMIFPEDEEDIGDEGLKNHGAAEQDKGGDDEPPTPPQSGGGGKPKLRVVK